MLDFEKYKGPDAKSAEAFRLDAFEALGLEDNNVNNDLFQKAWRWGHVGGYEEVFEHFRDLVGVETGNDSHF